MKITSEEIQVLRAEQGSDRGLIVGEENNQPVLVHADVNFWAFVKVAEIRGNMIEVVKQVNGELKIELRGAVEEAQKLAFDLSEAHVLLDDLRATYVTAKDDDRPRAAVWEKTATDCGGPYKAHKTTDGWTVIDKHGNIAVWDANGTGLQFSNEIDMRRIALDWNAKA